MGLRMESTLESGYASGASSSASLPSIVIAKPHLKFLNNTLNNLAPIDVLRWCKITFPNLYQTTAFGVSGLVTLDMLSKIHAETPNAPTIDAIFLDTLYHFEETHALVQKTKARYPNVHLHVYKPEGVDTTAEFEARHGQELWKTNADLYDWVAKVEPAQRAYSDLSVAAVLTGRRRSQGSKRESLEIIEIDEAGLIKINPLATWSFKQVQDYIKENNVPYNALLDRGYKSVGDWHSTEPVKEGEDERAGRWKGQAKTECGIHNKRSKYAQFLFELEQKEQQERLSAALKVVEVHPSPDASPEQAEIQVEVVAKLEKVDAIEPLPETVEVAQASTITAEKIEVTEEVVITSEAMEGVELSPPSTPVPAPAEIMEGVEASSPLPSSDVVDVPVVSEEAKVVEEHVPTVEQISVPEPVVSQDAKVVEEHVPTVEQISVPEPVVSQDAKVVEEHVPAVEQIFVPEPVVSEDAKAVEEPISVPEIVAEVVAMPQSIEESTPSSEPVVLPAENKTEIASPTIEQTQFDSDLAAAMEKFEHPEQRVESITVEA